MKAYPTELRQRVLADCDSGQSTDRVAKKYRVSPAWVRRLKQRRRESGETAPRRAGGRRPRIVSRERLIELVKQQPDATLAELRDRLGIRCSLSAIWMALDALRISFKKNTARRRAGSARRGRTASAVARGASRSGS